MTTNRRGLFSLFAAAPLGAAAALSLKDYAPKPDDLLVRASSTYRCEGRDGGCNSHLHHVATTLHADRFGNHTHGFTRHVCTWCGADWPNEHVST